MTPGQPPAAPGQPSGLRLGLLALLLCLIVGCEGCRPGQADPSDPVTAPLNEFTFAAGRALPAGDQPLQTAIKPGHWFTASQSLRSNLADQRGTLWQQLSIPLTPADPAEGAPSDDGPQGWEAQRSLVPASAATAATITVGGRPAATVPLTSQRPAILPRGSSRRLDAPLLAGIPSSGQPRNAWLSSRFQSSISGVAAETAATPLTLMAPQEYLLVVLTGRPNRFSAWQTADWARQVRLDEDATLPPQNYFRIIMPPTDGVLMLPETALHWTSTAVLVWDDLAPEALTAEQARALRDWVHFGGRLLINGTGIDGRAMRGPIGDLLPMTVDGQTELDADDVAQMLQHWTVAGDSTTPQQISLAAQRTNRLMVSGRLNPAAQYLPHTAELIASRRVGNGAVLMTRFDLSSDWLAGWRSRDSFFNAVLLGRPPRQVIVSEQGWYQRFAGGGGSGLATAITASGGLRLFSRDATITVDPPPGAVTPPPGSLDASAVSAAEPPTAARPATTSSTDSSEQMSTFLPAGAGQRAEYQPHPQSGFGGWSDDSDLAKLALQQLTWQSGVDVPDRRFVFRSLAIYLVVLVPLNYLVFRLLGRLEWAWAAIPLIGLGGAAWIAQAAQLDMGLARSQTEIAIVEMHGGYDRGHATRFISLYNSLSARYDFHFANSDAVAAPVGVLRSTGSRDRGAAATLQSGTAAGPVLAGVEVASNRTRQFHVEQFFDTGGAIVWQNDQLINDSDLDLQAVQIVRRDPDGSLRWATFDQLPQRSRATVHWHDSPPVPPGHSPGHSLANSPDHSLVGLDPDDSVAAGGRLLPSLADPAHVPPGAVRLVAISRTLPPGLEIQPAGPQHSGFSVVVVHLRRPALPTADRGDENLPPTEQEFLQTQRSPDAP